MSNSQSWSVIIMCFNEEGTLQSVYDSVRKVMTEMASAFEVIIVDDGSTDQSPVIASGIVEKHPEDTRAIFHEKNLGIGFTLRNGYETAQYENICAVPADGQFDVTELLPFRHIESKTFVSFYRKENLQYTLFRNILSVINKKINALFMGIVLKDVNWVKVYKRAELRKLDLRVKSSLVESEICSKLLLNGNKVVECISVYHPRVAGVSKGASPKIVWQAIQETWKLVFIINRFRKGSGRAQQPL